MGRHHDDGLTEGARVGTRSANCRRAISASRRSACRFDNVDLLGLARHLSSLDAAIRESSTLLRDAAQAKEINAQSDVTDAETDVLRLFLIPEPLAAASRPTRCEK